MKKQSLLFYLAVTLLLVSCQNGKNGSENPTVIEGTVEQVDEYGGLQPTFTPQQLENAGVEYGDLLTISIGDSIEIDAPYVDAYTEAGSMSPCLCNHNKSNVALILSMTNGSFVDHVGGKVGDKFIIKMKKKAGYLSEYNLLSGVYDYERSLYQSDAVFANFREISATGLKPATLYRSTSPISFKKNKVRYKYAAALCDSNDILTIIDIADTDEKVDEYMAAPENDSSYLQECYIAGNIVGLGSNADYVNSVFMSKLARGMREIIAKPAPYLIHCNEGKDRTGFYCLLLEALCGATVQEMKTDYMLTFENLYRQTRGSAQYELTWRKNGFRMLYQIANPNTWTDIISVDWDGISIDGVNMSTAAYNYLVLCGLSDAEITSLKQKIAQ